MVDVPRGVPGPGAGAAGPPGTRPVGRLRFVDLFTPADLRDRYGAWGGSIYGAACSGRFAALRRPGNRGPKRGLYLVGGSAHPGGGLPLVTMGARIVASLVEEDFPTGAVR